jgi:hypothetical protein
VLEDSTSVPVHFRSFRIARPPVRPERLALLAASVRLAGPLASWANSGYWVGEPVRRHVSTERILDVQRPSS